MSEEERKAIEQCRLLLAGDIHLHVVDEDDGGTAYTGVVNKGYNKDLETVLNLIEKLENMYKKEYNEHMEMKRQNEVLRNNERILKEKIEELEEEVEQLKVNEEILMKTKGCLDEDSSTDCRVLESLNYGIRAYEKTLRNSVHKDKIRELKEKIHNALDNNGITRAYQIKIDEYFEELLEEEKNERNN